MPARAAVLLALVALAAATAVPGGRLNKYVERFEALEVRQEHVLRRSATTGALQLHPRTFTLNLEAYGRTFTLDLELDNSLFAPTMNTTIVGQHTGQVWSMEDRRFYKGRVRNHPDSFVHIRVALDGTIHGNFFCDGEAYAIDPSEYHFDKDSVSFKHVIYRQSDHDSETTTDVLPGTCHKMVPKFDAATMAESYARRAAFDNSNTHCHIALAADYKFYDNIGNDDVGQTVEKMTTRFANVKQLFDDNALTVDGVLIGIKVGQIEVVDSAVSTRFVMDNPSSTDGVDLLDKFSEYDWEDYCLAHLYTYEDFDNGLLGLAWVGRSSSTPGGICQQGINDGGQQAYLNTGFHTQINFGSRVSDLTSYLVMAHEFGHNFGSDHDTTAETSGGNFLMWPVSVDGSRSNHYLFSTQSKTSMQNVIDAKGGCFQASDAAICGNGVQEGTEECDCGTGGACASIDSCCNSDGSCTLDGGPTTCSPFHSQHGACCTEACAKITSGECREETECTKSVDCDVNAECAAADEFDEFTVCDETNPSRMCDDSGRCTKSICELWGLTESFVAASVDSSKACKVTCDDSGTDKTITEVDASNTQTQNALDRDTGANFPLTTDIERAAGELCLFTATKNGICDSSGTCQDADGSETAFDQIENFIKNFSASDALNWLQEEDAYIPNWAWVAIGVGLLIFLISCCCYCSNKNDKKNGVV